MVAVKQINDDGAGDSFYRASLSPNEASLLILLKLHQGEEVTLTPADGEQLATTVELSTRAVRVANAVVGKMIETS